VGASAITVTTTGVGPETLIDGLHVLMVPAGSRYSLVATNMAGGAGEFTCTATLEAATN
jgi:hypothetical protein